MASVPPHSVKVPQALRSGYSASPQQNGTKIMQALSVETTLYQDIPEAEVDADMERISEFARQSLRVDDAELIFVDEVTEVPNPTLVSQRLANLVVSGNTVIAVPDVIFEEGVSSGNRLCGFLGVPVCDALGIPVAALCVMTRQTRIWSRSDRQTLNFLGGELEAIFRMRDAVEIETRRTEQQQLVAREYHHRIRNAFSVSSAVIVLTGAQSSSIQSLVETTSGQLAALADAHTAIGFDEEAADLAQLIHGALQPYTFSDALFDTEGPEVEISENKVISVSLILNELATNSTKYGALRLGGEVQVTWTVLDGALRLCWVERTDEPRTTCTDRAGSFGGTMTEVSVTQLKATLERKWLDNGLEVSLTFPI